MFDTKLVVSGLLPRSFFRASLRDRANYGSKVTAGILVIPKILHASNL
jgi:hypothetical protein